MSLIHPSYFSYLEHYSAIITIVFALGIMSLFFGATGKGGGAAKDKKDDDKPAKRPDPADEPVNFLDSVTGSLTDATAGDDEPEAAAQPGNFFDSATMGVMGGESAKQLLQLEEIQNPQNFFNYFSGSVAGLTPPPPPYIPAGVVNMGITTPLVPQQPEVPFMRAEEEEVQKREVQEKSEMRERDLRENAYFEKIIREKEFAESAREMHELALRKEEAQKIEEQPEEEDELQKKIRIGGMPRKPHAVEDPVVHPFSDEAKKMLEGLKGKIEKMMQAPGLDKDSYEMLFQIKRAMEQNMQLHEKLKKELHQQLEKNLTPDEMDKVERMLEKKDEPEKKQGEGEEKDDDSAKNNAKEFDKVVVVLKAKCTNQPGFSPMDVIAQNQAFMRNYAQVS